MAPSGFYKAHVTTSAALGPPGEETKEHGYEGILAPSARDPNGANLVYFKGW